MRVMKWWRGLEKEHEFFFLPSRVSRREERVWSGFGEGKEGESQREMQYIGSRVISAGCLTLCYLQVLEEVNRNSNNMCWKKTLLTM